MAGADQCPECGWEPTPDPGTWSREMKAMVWKHYLSAVLGGPRRSEAQGWRWILKESFRGRWVELEGRKQFVPWAATAEDVYPIALALAEGRATLLPERT